MKRQSILIILLCVILPLVVVSVAGISFFAEKHIKNLAVRLATEAARGMANASLIAIEGPMKAGRDEETRQVFKRLEASRAAIVRIVSCRFPDLPLVTYSSKPGEAHPVIDQRLLIDQVGETGEALAEMQLLRQGRRPESLVVEGTAVALIKSIPNTRECLHCHRSVDIGRPLGLVSVRQDIGIFLNEAEKTAGFLMLFIASAEGGTILLISLMFWMLTLRPLTRVLGFVQKVGEADQSNLNPLKADRFIGREIRSLAEGLNQMLAVLEEKDRFVHQNIGGAVDKLISIINHLLDAFIRIRHGVSGQTAASGQIGQAMAEISDAAEKVSDQAARTAAEADKFSQNIRAGLKVTDQMLEAMNQTRTVVGDSRKSAVEAASMTGEISRIIAVIDDIAFQTNLLALNAAVEAARAGKQGRGFAVVAQQVRSLAAQSARAAQDIKGIIETATQKINRNVDQGEQITNNVELTAGLAVKTAGLIKELSVFLDGITTGVNRINDAAAQQAAATEQTHATSEQIAETSRQTEKTVRDMAEIVEELKGITGRLGDLTGAG